MPHYSVWENSPSGRLLERTACGNRCELRHPEKILPRLFLDHVRINGKCRQNVDRAGDRCPVLSAIPKCGARYLPCLLSVLV